MNLGKKARLRFKVEDDLVVLKAILAENPFEDSSKWRKVHVAVCKGTGKAFSLRTIRDHVELLMRVLSKHGQGRLRR